jgi:hypothetical protein
VLPAAPTLVDAVCAYSVHWRQLLLPLTWFLWPSSSVGPFLLQLLPEPLSHLADPRARRTVTHSMDSSFRRWDTTSREFVVTAALQ